MSFFLLFRPQNFLLFFSNSNWLSLDKSIKVKVMFQPIKFLVEKSYFMYANCIVQIVLSIAVKINCSHPASSIKYHKIYNDIVHQNIHAITYIILHTTFESERCMQLLKIF